MDAHIKWNTNCGAKRVRLNKDRSRRKIGLSAGKCFATNACEQHHFKIQELSVSGVANLLYSKSLEILRQLQPRWIPG